MSRPVVLITGASRGIGAAIAIDAAREGYDVAFSYHSNKEAADVVVSAVADHGSRAIAVQADNANEGDLLALFEQVDQQFGRLDALVNNAGIVAPSRPFTTYSVQRMQQIFNTNILGAFIAAREAVLRLSTRSGGQGGSIINISSIAARAGAANEYIDYAASKAALDAMTTGLAKEVADQGIRVNSIRPGLIHTDIHASGGRPDRVNELSAGIPMQRGGQASEVADTAIWLMSKRASYVTGACIDVSGGR
ncbi:MAG: SDR family oxidoreductase [Burkholderiaceae bacterium]